jgi:hypothetical protein
MGVPGDGRRCPLGIPDRYLLRAAQAAGPDFDKANEGHGTHRGPPRPRRIPVARGVADGQWTSSVASMRIGRDTLK